jgi:methyltransferase (TIGR00027 family)
MKEGKASRSADGTAALRAVESLKLANERVLHDPYAIQFLSGIYSTLTITRFLIPFRLLVKIIDWYASRTHPGGISYMVVRPRYIDDYLIQCIEDGIEQLVILGAGYDSRAFRFNALKEKVRVFEIDHPDSQKIKKEKVRKIFGSLPDHVVYVPVDFNKEKPDEKLYESGYDKNLKTLFIWEGVTMYLTAEAVDETLAFVVNKSGEGSSIIFDYAYESVIDGRMKMKEAEKLIKLQANIGEPLTFGIEDGTIMEFLGVRGFGQVEDMNAKSLEDTYFKGTNRKSCPFFGIVHATVKPREGS